MNRRKFLKKASVAGAAPLVIGGLPVQSFAMDSKLQRAAASSTNDKVIVLIQLHGGNDGLNCVIPVDRYNEYYNARPNIAIPDKGNRKYITLDSPNLTPDEKQVGLHPDMMAMKQMYDMGMAAVIQNVGYENMNGSHFRSRDIWFMGGDFDDEWPSGWIGRYLDEIYPGYPKAYPNDQMRQPLALEIGNSMSLAFHREEGIPVSIGIRNPEQFFNLIEKVDFQPPQSVADTRYGEELNWIMNLETQTDIYAGELHTAYNAGMNSSVDYPSFYPMTSSSGSRTNPLSGQLRMIARLIDGQTKLGQGKTKVYLAKIGGFDTHANQVENYDPSMGSHGAKMYHLTTAIKAFYDDLRALGHSGDVATLTFSEFGRRIYSNASYGTDHGKAGPMFVFGEGVTPGVYGTNQALQGKGNLSVELDYRDVFTALLKDWLGADYDTLDKTGFGDRIVQHGDQVHLSSDVALEQNLDVLFKGQGGLVSSVREDFINQRYRLHAAYPNPARWSTTISYRINDVLAVRMGLYNTEGKLVKMLVNEKKGPGEHQVSVAVQGLPEGIYYYRIEAGILRATKQLIVIK
ncbi:DUF1501 domain-containing protein [Algivirga pacifica]|uniref:DUF1501 domain-containing protein n=1 Tax=Algivirga pacifica TaxID=1162670 RepID=A0ABP9DF98_9BACT